MSELKVNTLKSYNSGQVTVVDPMTVSGNLTVNGATVVEQLTSRSIVDSATSDSARLSITDSEITLGANTTVSGTNTMTVSGLLTANAGMNVTGGLTVVSGGATISGGNLTINGGGISVPSGTTTLSGTMNVTGASTFSTVTATSMSVGTISLNKGSPVFIYASGRLTFSVAANNATTPHNVSGLTVAAMHNCSASASTNNGGVITIAFASAQANSNYTAVISDNGGGATTNALVFPRTENINANSFQIRVNNATATAITGAVISFMVTGTN